MNTNDESKLRFAIQLVATLERQLQQAERDRDTLATEVRAWRDVGSSHQLRAVQAEADRDVLAAEVRAWRRWEDVASTTARVIATDESGALERAK